MVCAQNGTGRASLLQVTSESLTVYSVTLFISGSLSLSVGHWGSLVIYIATW